MDLAQETALILKMSDAAIRAILLDMRLGTVPPLVGSFSELHDHVDANEYGLEVVKQYMSNDTSFNWMIEHIANPAQAIVDTWLKARSSLSVGKAVALTCEV